MSFKRAKLLVLAVGIAGLMLYCTIELQAQIIGENPVMDMRVRQGTLTWGPATGTLEIYLDVRAIDGNAWDITQMQNSLVLDEPFRDVVQEMTVSERAFPASEYQCLERFTSGDGVLEFMCTLYPAGTPVALGGPDADTWHQVIKFAVVFTRTSGYYGNVVWFHDTPHYNVRAYNPALGRTETIHNEEFGELCNIPLNVYAENPVMDIQMYQLSNTHYDQTGTLELLFELRTTDGLLRPIAQLQDSVIFDEQFRQLVHTPVQATWGPTITAYNYAIHERWTPPEGVLEYAINKYDFAPAYGAGGPDADTWHPLVTFTVNYTLTPGAVGTIQWYDNTPHFNIRAKRLEGGGTETVHNQELGKLLVPLGDPLPAVQFSSTAYNTSEGAGSATITVTLNTTGTQTVTVDYTTGDGTATQPDDYTTISGTLTFTPGITSQAFTVIIADDEIEEGEETVSLMLFNAENAIIGGNNPAVLTITDEFKIHLPLILHPGADVTADVDEQQRPPGQRPTLVQTSVLRPLFIFRLC